MLHILLTVFMDALNFVLHIAFRPFIWLIYFVAAWLLLTVIDAIRDRIKEQGWKKQLQSMAMRLDSNQIYDIKIDKSGSLTNNACAILVDNRKAILIHETCIAKFSESELGFILAHEIAHHQLCHNLKKVNGWRYRLLNWANNSVAGSPPVKVVEKVPLFGRLMDKVKKGIGLGAALLTLSESREHELEADCKAVELLESANMISIVAIPTLRKLYEGQSKPGFMEKLSNTHPHLEARINAVEKKLKALGCTTLSIA